MATKQQVYCKKTSSKVLRKNHNGPINVSRCSKTDVSSENSDDCVYDNNHCGLVTRKNNRVVSRSHATSKKHHVSKVHVPSNCTNNYLSTNRCDEPCKSVASYKTKNGKIRRASCRSLKSKMLRGGSPPPVDPAAAPPGQVDPPSSAAPAQVTDASAPTDIKQTLKNLRATLGSNVPPGAADVIGSEFVQKSLIEIQSITKSKVDPKNELKQLDLNNDGRVELNDIILLASFKLADADASGSLSLAEAEKGLTAMMNGIPANLTDKEFQTADISGNNSLDFTEYQLLYVFKSNGKVIDNEFVLSKAQLAQALKELGITSATNSDIENADMNKNDKIDFPEFLLLVTFKWADMNIDKTQIADSKLDFREASMAFRLLGMEITRQEFDQANTDKTDDALDFNEFTTFVAYKKVMKDNTIMDKKLLDQALDFLSLSTLANEKRESKASLRAEAAKKGADQAELDQKAKEEKERLDAKRATIKAENEREIALAKEKGLDANMEEALTKHLATLKVCDELLLKNPETVRIPSDSQVCLTKAQIAERITKLPKCDGAKIVNLGTEVDFPMTQVCQQGGRSTISLNQFMNIVKSIRRNRLQQAGHIRQNRRQMYF